MLANLRRCGDQSTCPPPVPCLHTALTIVSSTCAINSERRGVGVKHPRKAMPFSQQTSSPRRLRRPELLRHACHPLKPQPPLRQDLLRQDPHVLHVREQIELSPTVETKGSVRKENIGFWHVEVRFKNLLHFSQSSTKMMVTTTPTFIRSRSHRRLAAARPWMSIVLKRPILFRRPI